MPTKTKRQHIPFTVASREGNLLVIQTEKWNQSAPKLVLRGVRNARSALTIFIVIAPGIGPEKWTIGWVRGDLTSDEKNTARIRTAKKNGLVPIPLLPNEASWIPFIVASINVTMLRELALMRTASIAREVTRLERARSFRHGVPPRKWSCGATRAKLLEATVALQYLV